MPKESKKETLYIVSDEKHNSRDAIISPDGTPNMGIESLVRMIA
jgi:hypothetical protein